jgi:hypothetical protein
MDSGSPPSTATSKPIDYGPRIRFLQRGKLHRWIIAATVLIVVIAIAPRAGIALHYLRIYYYERRYLSHPLAPNTTVFSYGPALATTTNPWIDRLSREVNFENGHLFNSVYTPVYAGIRTAKNGSSRFVIVVAHNSWQAGKFIPPHTYQGGFLWDLFFIGWSRPTGLFQSDTQNVRSGTLSGLGYQPVGRRNFSDPWPIVPKTSICSAAEDPTDPAHFTLQVYVDAEHFVVDCRLMPDGSVEFKWFEWRRFESPFIAGLMSDEQLVPWGK